MSSLSCRGLKEGVRELRRVEVPFLAPTPNHNRYRQLGQPPLSNIAFS